MSSSTTKMTILVYFEYHYRRLHPVGLQLMSAAQELTSNSGGEIHGIVIGEDADQAEEQMNQLPLSKVYLYESEEYFKSDLYKTQVLDCIQQSSPEVVLMGGTKEGRSLAPRVSAALKTGLTADCTELYVREGSELVQIRPAFGGNLMAQIITPDTRPQMATLRYNQFPPLKPSASEAARRKPVSFIKRKLMPQPSSLLKITETMRFTASESIAKQDVLVAAGRGVRSKEDLDMIIELAELLGGELASTRRLVEQGWISFHRQIGLSGHSVRPKLLLTIGVSGSVQFMAGIRGAETIIAINSDEDAPIFSAADHAYCGDLYEIVPALISTLKKQNT